jgi:CubicO group peptidase (beta-lactamase class C family)
VGINQNTIEQATGRLLDNSYPNTDSIVIVRNGLLVHEAYFNGFSATRRHDLRSATKSITSILVGIAIDNGSIGDASEPALPYIPGYPNILNWDDRKNSIRIQDFLTMRPGLACDDQNLASPGNERNMYGLFDWVEFVLNLPIINDPGDVYGYCTAGVVALGAVIDAATGTPVDTFATGALFGPLGIVDYNWEYTPKGRVDTGGHIHLRPRDMAKIGELMLRRGNWGGSSIVSETWVDTSTSYKLTLDSVHDYGYLWWRRLFGSVGQYSAYFASGNGGQYIFVVPSADLVVVFTGGNYNSPLSSQPFEIMSRYVIPALN